MTRAEARTAINSTFEEVSGSPTSAELNTWIDLEHKNFRRELQNAFPSAFATTSAEQTIAAGSDAFTLPADFERMVRLERKSGENWFPVDVSDELTPHMGDVAFREEGATSLKIDPLRQAPGTYRLVYIATTTTLSAESGAGGVLLVPGGCEDIIVERVAARCRIKLDEDPAPHQARAAAIWVEQKRALKKRYGRHAVPGLRQVRRW